MPCYYCNSAGSSTEGVGVCKNCSVVACTTGSGGRNHGTKCQYCRNFFCVHCAANHKKDHPDVLGELDFVQLWNSIINSSLTWLANPNSKELKIISENGQILSDVLGNTEMKIHFQNMLSKEIIGLPEYTLKAWIPTANKFDDLKKMLIEAKKEFGDDYETGMGSVAVAGR